MRKIKFRAWDEKEKIMRYLHLIYNSVAKNRHILMQYTGLNDMNDREIYEGDILHCSDHSNSVVTWDENFASFCLTNKGEFSTRWFGESAYPSEYEVIGNIYENAELMSQVDSLVRHGINCEKVSHYDKSGYQIAGMLHFPEDDRPYDVDGCIYCGRCHVAINENDVVVDKDGYA